MRLLTLFLLAYAVLALIAPPALRAQVPGETAGTATFQQPTAQEENVPPGDIPPPTLLPPSTPQPLEQLQKLQENVRNLQKLQAAAQADGGKEVQQKQMEVLQKQIEVQQKMIELLVDQLRKQAPLGPAVEQLQQQTATLEARGLLAARRDQQIAGAIDDMKEQYDADRRNLPQFFPAQLRELFAPQQTNETQLSIYGVYVNNFNKLANSNAAFNFGEFSPQFLLMLNEQFLLEAETSFGPGGSPSLGRAQLDWLLGDHTLVAGLFESPIGFFNERLNHPWFNKLPDQPLMFFQVSPGGLDFLGLQMRGSKYVFNSPVKLEYATFVSNGLNTTTSPAALTDVANLEGLTNTFNSVANAKAFGGRVGFWYPAVGLTGGLSALWNGPYLGGQSDYINLFQADMGYNNGKGLDMRFEAAQMFQEATATIGNNIVRRGLFAQIAYRPLTLPNGFWQKTEYVFRFSAARFDGINTAALNPMPFGSSLDVPVNRNQFTFGVNYYFYASLVLRFAWEVNRELGITKFSDDQFLSQLAWAF
jgi:hypothetical protein